MSRAKNLTDPQIMVMAVNYREKIIALWTVFLLGILFHTQLGLMPLFHGLSVFESQKATTINDISGIMWLMLVTKVFS
jgi:hypothetical protein